MLSNRMFFECKKNSVGDRSLEKFTEGRVSIFEKNESL
jgi:hypothetical protein